jgi:hypothetical protein
MMNIVLFQDNLNHFLFSRNPIVRYFMIESVPEKAKGMITRYG